MKVLQIKVHRLKLFGCSLKLLANVQCTSTRKRSVSPASYFTDMEKKEHKRLKKSTVFILHFAPSLRFTLSLQSAFYTQSAFYPWSAVCSPQSAVCVSHWPVCFVPIFFDCAFPLIIQHTKGQSSSSTLCGSLILCVCFFLCNWKKTELTCNISTTYTEYVSTNTNCLLVLLVSSYLYLQFWNNVSLQRLHTFLVPVHLKI